MVEIFYQDERAMLLHGDVLDCIRSLPTGSVHCVVTSVPYWALRDYGLPPSVWGGRLDCEHQWLAPGKMHRGGPHGDGQMTNGGRSVVEAQAKVKDIDTGSFCAECGAWFGCLGLEPTPDLYIRHMVEVFHELMRVLRDDGVLWLNVGDSYAGTSTYNTKNTIHTENGWKQDGDHRPNVGTPPGYKPTDMVGIPWMLAFALRADGWYLRSDVIWAKRNPMPESVSGWRWVQHRRKVAKAVENWREEGEKRAGVVESAVNHVSGGNTGFKVKATFEDCPGCKICSPNDGLILRKGSWRPTKAHEYMFLLAKTSSYFCDMEAVRESKGANLRDVWTLSTQPRADAHFATFPDALVEPCIKAGTSEKGCCITCGSPWVRVVEPTPEYAALLGESWHEHETDGTQYGKRHDSGGPAQPPEEQYRTVDWRASCTCLSRDPVPCVVYDPFIGSGTTIENANRLGRIGWGSDLSGPYLEIAEKRIRPHGGIQARLMG